MHKLKHSLLLAALLIAAICAVACGSAETGSSEQSVGSKSQDLFAWNCSTDAQCQSLSWTQIGWCADPSTGVCVANACNYDVDYSNSACHCIAGEERKCPGGGFQTCFQNYSTSGADWPLGANGGCTALFNYSSQGQYKTCTSPSSNNCMGSIVGGHFVPTWTPACASIDTINQGNACFNKGTNNTCHWSLTTDPAESGCVCVEDEVQDCLQLPSGVPGHKLCYKDTTTSASNTWGHPTKWGTCQ